jgi:hypothetical protein
MTLNEKLTLLDSELQRALAQSDKVATLQAEITALKKLIDDEETGENQYAKEYAEVVHDQTEKALSDAEAKTIDDNTTQADPVKAEVDEVNNKIKELPDLTIAKPDADKVPPELANQLSLNVRVPHTRLQRRRSFVSGPLAIFLVMAVSVAIDYLWHGDKRSSIRSASQR